MDSRSRPETFALDTPEDATMLKPSTVTEEASLQDARLPQPMKRTLLAHAADVGLDLLYFVSCLMFLIFAVAAKAQDGVLSEEHPKLHTTLLQAAKYVCDPRGP